MIKSAFLIFILSSCRSYGNNLVLNEGWIVSNSDLTFQEYSQNIPSGVFTVLESAMKTDSILDSYNDVKLRWISNTNWKYTNQFDAPANFLTMTNIYLVFHGIDTVATIKFNNYILGTVDNMFVRHRFKVNGLIQSSKNIIEVEFRQPALEASERANISDEVPPECPPQVYHGECHINMLRKMQSSFAWDWGLAAPSMGIWKSVVLEAYQSAIIRDIIIDLAEDDDFWTVFLKVIFEMETKNSSKELNELHGNIYIDLLGVLDEPIKEEVILDINDVGEQIYSTSFKIPKDKIDRWWPNGYGKQPLYILNVRWDGSSQMTMTNAIPRQSIQYFQSEKELQIGFRTIQLMQEKLDDGLSFYFIVNNVPIFMKGSNWIPMDILPEKHFNMEKMKYLLSAAKDSHMNMLRVWGGGVYESDEFYKLADQYGLLIWQDMMFACAMYPVNDEFISTVMKEIKQNIRRIQHHPSIAIWGANNENEVALRQNWYSTNGQFKKYANDYIILYVNTIKKVVSENDDWHPFLTSSPSNGKFSEEQNYLADDPQNWHYGDIHYYNYISDGWNPNIYPKPRFASEYGFQSLPSITSWRTVLKNDDNLTDLLTHRQHSPLGNTPIIRLIAKHLPLPSKDQNDYMETLIYFSQISQAMVVKQETESYRVGRGGSAKTMGALFWQLNDVWVAPSWSSIEFDGTFKILHHWAKQFLAPKYIVAHPDPSGKVTITAIRDDLGVEEEYDIAINVIQWNVIAPITTDLWHIQMLPNTVKQVAQFNFSDYFPIRSNLALERFIQIEMRDNQKTVIATNYVFPTKLKDCIGIMDPMLEVYSVLDRCSNAGHSRVSIEIRIKKPAIFVYLEMKKPLAKFQISDNGFMQLNAIKTIYVEYSNPNCDNTLTEKDFKVTTVNDFMHKINV